MTKKQRCLYHLENMIDHATDEDENEITMPVSFADELYTLIDSQEIKEPLQDVIFFVGKPTKETICYHALVRDVTYQAMLKDSNLHMTNIKYFTGVMDQEHMSAVKPISKDNKYYCGSCGKRLQMKFKPYYCHKCGRMIDYEKGSENNCQ